MNKLIFLDLKVNNILATFQNNPSSGVCATVIGSSLKHNGSFTDEIFAIILSSFKELKKEDFFANCELQNMLKEMYCLQRTYSI